MDRKRDVTPPTDFQLINKIFLAVKQPDLASSVIIFLEPMLLKMIVPPNYFLMKVSLPSHQKLMKMLY